MENPVWSLPYFNDELAGFQADNLAAADALLLGRVTYEDFKAVWSNMTNEGDFAERMNGIPKHVVTTTLTEPEWNASFVSGDPAAAVTDRKARPGNDLLINGSGQLLRHLTAHGLVDEYRFMIFPLMVGAGKRLFDDTGAQRGLTLTDSTISASGVAILTYVPAEAA